MKINLFGLSYDLNDLSNVFSKKDSSGIDNGFINYMQNNYEGMKFVGTSITDCWPIRISKNTMYWVHKNNKMAFAYSNKVAQMVGAEGIEIVDERGQTVKTNYEAVTKLMQLIGKQHDFFNFRQQFYNQHFCAGNVFGVPSQINGLWLLPNGQGKFKILDSRGITKQTDRYGEKKIYQYTTRNWNEKFTDMQIVDFITNLDVDNNNAGLSIYNSIVMDAIMHHESTRTQMYYFKNDQRPNMVIMLNPEAFSGANGKEKKQEFDQIRQKNYGWPENAGKAHSSYLIKDVKTLDTSNVDLDLLELRESNDSAISAVYMLDARLIGLQKKTGSYWEVESTTIMQGNNQIDNYGDLLANFLSAMYVKFVDPKFAFNFKMRNARFRNINADKEVMLKEVKQNVISGDEYRKEFNYDVKKT